MAPEAAARQQLKKKRARRLDWASLLRRTCALDTFRARQVWECANFLWFAYRMKRPRVAATARRRLEGPLHFAGRQSDPRRLVPLKVGNNDWSDHIRYRRATVATRAIPRAIHGDEFHIVDQRRIGPARLHEPALESGFGRFEF